MEDIDLGVCKGRWYAGDPARVAIVLPGARYLPFAPLLWFARSVATNRDWSVLEVWDEYLDRSDDPWRWAEDRADAALARIGDATVVLVTKSLTSHAVRVAAQRNLSGIWLTPLLHNDEIAAGFAALQAPALLIGGTADESWDVSAASRHDVLEIEGADHALQLPEDPAASVAALGRIVDRMDEFVGRL